MNKGAGISLLVPFRDDSKSNRLKVWTWLLKYWENALPEAEIVVGTDDGMPFSKTCALNNAYKKCTGDIIVLLDADCFIDPNVITDCADKIRQFREEGNTLWYVPYRNLYRLTYEATDILINSDPNNPLQYPNPPNLNDVIDIASSSYGHWFGALIQIMPREAFETTGGMDPQFRGWGGEDVSYVRILDTLYGVHKTTKNQVFALYHDKIGNNELRMWEGQEKTGTNNQISIRYRKAYQDKIKMRRIIAEWCQNPKYNSYLINHNFDDIDTTIVDVVELDEQITPVNYYEKLFSKDFSI